MKYLKQLLKNRLPEGIILGVTALVAWINYIPQTTLTGWDNLHPEFFLSMNIKRSVFAVWQEYQSLGLLGGMGHAADLLRQIWLALATILLQPETVRYTTTIVFLLIGSLGAYHLSKKLHPSQSKLLPTTAALFYMLNLATIQMFYAPFEAFTAHFAALPFFLLAGITYIQKPQKKYLLAASIVYLLTTPQAYIPTLFVASMLALTILTTFTYLVERKRQILTSTAKLFGIIAITNAFWALPFAYFTLTNSDVNLNAKINQMATENIYAQNKEFGNIQDVALLKGFWFNNIDVNLEGNFSPMLAPWRTHMDNLLPQIAGYILFALILTGVITTLATKDKKRLPFALLFIFAFTMLATSTPLFEQANNLFRKIPLFDQAFRFPFTKFSIITALTYAIFLPVGIEKVSKFIKNTLQKNTAIPTTIITLILIATLSFPVFRGHLFYEKEQIKIPQEYHNVFTFFKNQDPNTRIANLPQHTFWGWSFYRWGYGGSGFLWYGIKQPILDRAFDVWSRQSENYYYEISKALYAQDAPMLENVLNKYNINWIILDKNIIYPIAPNSLALADTQNLLNSQDYIEFVQKFEDIFIYKVDLKNKHQDFLYTVENLPNINDYKWGEYDFAHEFTQGYKTQEGEEYEYYIPFRTLHSNRMQKDTEYNLKKEGNTVTLTAQIPQSDRQRQLFVPEFLLREDTITTRISKKTQDDGSINIVATPTLPIIKIGNKQTVSHVGEIPLFTLPENKPIQININGTTEITLEKDSDTIITALSLTQPNILVAEAEGDTRTLEINPEQITRDWTTQNIQVPDEQSTIEIKILTPNDNYYNHKVDPTSLNVKNCDNYRTGKFTPTRVNEKLNIEAINATACTVSHSRNLTHNTGYAVFVEAQNHSGRPLHFWVLNNTRDIAPIDTHLPQNSEKSVSKYIFSPYERFGKGYSLHFDNISIGKKETRNTLIAAEIVPIPYNFITSLTLVSEGAGPSEKASIPHNTTHENESLYTVVIDSPQTTNLVLSQSFNPGWKAYAIENTGLKEKIAPFLFGDKIKEHMKVNNWQNGWEIEGKDSPTSLVIVYLPQYLQYAGFIILAGYIIFLAFHMRLHKKKFPHLPK